MAELFRRFLSVFSPKYRGLVAAIVGIVTLLTYSGSQLLPGIQDMLSKTDKNQQNALYRQHFQIEPIATAKGVVGGGDITATIFPTKHILARWCPSKAEYENCRSRWVTYPEGPQVSAQRIPENFPKSLGDVNNGDPVVVFGDVGSAEDPAFLMLKPTNTSGVFRCDGAYVIETRNGVHRKATDADFRQANLQLLEISPAASAESVLRSEPSPPDSNLTKESHYTNGIHQIRSKH